MELKSAKAQSAGFTSRQRTIALVIVSFAFIMDLLDNTIVNIAIPTIQTHLHTSYATIQWLIAGYSLAFSLILITGGRMGDVFGYKKMFMIGVSGFTIASFLSGISVSGDMLIAARFFQGSMAALMVPQVMSLMQVMYQPHERGAINGMFGMMGGLAASLGPIVGGLLIKADWFGLDWRPIFLINIPVGVFALIAAQRFLPEGKSEHPLKLDLIGTLIIVAALSLLIYPLIEGRQDGWPGWTFIMIACSLPLFILFALWLPYKNKKDASPLVVPSLFRSRSFSAGLLINLIFEATMLGFFLINTLMLQIGLGFDAIHAALTGLPVAIAIAMTMGIAGEKLIPKIGRLSPQIGAIVMLAGLLVVSATFQHYSLHTHSWQLIPGYALIGIGMGFTFASLFAVVLNGIDVRHAGAASGILNAVQQVGGAIGIALIGVVFFGQLASNAPSSFSAQEPKLKAVLTAQAIPSAEQANIFNQAEQCFTDRSRQKDPTAVPASCRTKGESNSKITNEIVYASNVANVDNFTHGMRIGLLFEAALLIVIFALTFILPSKFKVEAFQEI